MEDSGIQAELNSLKKGKVSLAAALHQLDLVSASFGRMQDLETAVSAQEQSINELKGLMKYFVSATGLRAALDQFTHDLHSTLDSKFSNFREVYDRQLEVRPELSIVEAALSTKAAYTSVLALQEQVRSLRGQFETLTSSVFESFKVEMKRSLASKLDAGMLRDTVKDVVDSPAWKAVQDRLTLLEQARQERAFSPDTVQIDTSQMFPDPSSPLIRLIDTGIGSATAGSPVQSPRHQSSSLVNLQVAELERSVSTLQQDLAEARTEEKRLHRQTEERMEELERTCMHTVQAIREVETVKKRVDLLEGRKSPERSPPKSVEIPSNLNMEKYARQQELASKRFVQIETSVNSLLITTKYLKSKDKEKFNEVIKSLQFLNNSRDSQARDLAALKARSEEIEKSQTKALTALQEELLTLRGPMIDMLSTQARESGALSLEIKRHQDLLRSFAKGETGSSLESRLMTPHTPSLKCSQQLQTSRVDFQPRVQSASPGVRLRHRLHAPNDTDIKPKIADLKYISSQRSTPKRLLDVEKSLARASNTEL